MANNDIQYLIVKLQGIQKQLGGPMDNLVKPESDEFNRVKLALTENINFITKKQDERDNIEATAGRTMAVIKAGIDIKDRLSDTEDQLSQMKDALRRQRKNPKKYPENQIEVKEKQLENCRRMVEQLTVRENGGTIDSEEKPISLTDMKLRLNAGGGRRNQNAYIQKDLSQDEANALKAFQEKDRELDSMIMQIDEGLGMLRNKAEMMGEKIDNHHDLIADLDNEVGKTVAQLETENAKLKKVLYEYRKPGQFCMNVICLLVLLGLIGVIIKMSSQ